MGSIPESRRSHGIGNGNPLQYSCLGNSMERGAWQATVHRITKSCTWLRNWTQHRTHKMAEMRISPSMSVRHFRKVLQKKKSKNQSLKFQSPYNCLNLLNTKAYSHSYFSYHLVSLMCLLNWHTPKPQEIVVSMKLLWRSAWYTSFLFNSQVCYKINISI